MADVVDEIARPVGPVAHEGAAGRTVRVDGDGRDVDAVTPQALDVDAAEVVVADAADHAAGLAELGHLVDEDGGRPGRERPDERDRLQEAVADFRGHDLDQDLADGDDLLHGCSSQARPDALARRFPRDDRGHARPRLWPRSCQD